MSRLEKDWDVLDFISLLWYTGFTERSAESKTADAAGARRRTKSNHERIDRDDYSPLIFAHLSHCVCRGE